MHSGGGTAATTIHETRRAALPQLVLVMEGAIRTLAEEMRREDWRPGSARFSVASKIVFQRIVELGNPRKARKPVRRLCVC